MTPKEKANQLVKKMYDEHFLFSNYLTLYLAKKYALIAVDEIIEVSNEVYFSDHQIKYYEDVKQEIEKL